jgi:hypothetical protein
MGGVGDTLALRSFPFFLRKKESGKDTNPTAGSVSFPLYDPRKFPGTLFFVMPSCGSGIRYPQGRT